MKCVGYVRVSSDEQKKKGYSIEGQKKEIEIHARNNGETISEWYPDEGYSGTNIRRPALKQLLLDCANKKIDKIYIVDSDRLTRQPIHRYSINEVFRKYGIKVISNSEDWNTDTLQGRLAGEIKTLVAFHEVSQIKPRTIRGLKESARQGNYAKSRCPRGYRKVKNEKSKVENGKRLEIIPEWEEIIPLIFYSIANRTTSVLALAKDFNERKVGDESWSDKSIQRIIRNPIYKGTFETSWAYYENHQPAFVSEELWNRANASLDGIARQRKYYYLFGKLVYCIDCGTWARKDVTIKYIKGLKNKKIVNCYRYSECPVCKRRINEDKLKLNVMIEMVKRLSLNEEQLQLYEMYEEEIVKNRQKLELLEKEFDEGIISLDNYEETRKNILIQIKRAEYKKNKPIKKEKENLAALSPLEFRVFFQKHFMYIEYSFENKMVVRLVERKDGVLNGKAKK